MRTDEKMAPDGAGAQVQDVEQPDNITGDAAAQALDASEAAVDLALRYVGRGLEPPDVEVLVARHMPRLEEARLREVVEAAFRVASGGRPQDSDARNPLDRQALLKRLRDKLDLPLLDVDLVDGDEAILRLHLQDGRIVACRPSAVYQKSGLGRVVSGAGLSIRPALREIPGDEWDFLHSALLKLARGNVVRVGHEGTLAGAVREWLTDYLELAAVTDIDTAEAPEAAAAGAPLLESGTVLFRLADFLRHVRACGESVNSLQQLASLVAQAGAERRQSSWHGVKSVRWAVAAVDVGLSQAPPTMEKTEGA